MTRTAVIGSKASSPARTRAQPAPRSSTRAPRNAEREAPRTPSGGTTGTNPTPATAAATAAVRVRPAATRPRARAGATSDARTETRRPRSSGAHPLSLASIPEASFPSAASVRFAPPTARRPESEAPTFVRWYAEFPIGWLRMEAEDGILVALTAVAASEALSPPPGVPLDEAPFKRLLRELRQYFDGRLETFTTPIALRATPFQASVWRALLELPFGRVVSYRDIATKVGQPAAVRAVGAANGRNPIGVIVPCHRVIGSDKSLTGYSGGIDRKAALLALEKESMEKAGRRPPTKARK